MHEYSLNEQIATVNEQIANIKCVQLHSSHSAVTVSRQFTLSDSILNYDLITIEMFAYVDNNLSKSRKFTITMGKGYKDADVGNTLGYASGGVFWDSGFNACVGLTILSNTVFAVGEVKHVGYTGVYGAKIYGYKFG